MKASSLKTVLLLLLISMLEAQEYAVIISQNSERLTKGELKALYLKKSAYINGKKIIPLNLGARDTVRASFEKNILHLNHARLKSYWTKQHYLGKRPPLTMKSQESIKAFVKKVDGAIGYVNIENSDDGVYIIYKWSD